MRLQHNLYAVILLLFEHCVTFRGLAKWEVMRDDKTWVDLALLNSFEERLHVFLYVALASPDRDRAIHQRACRELINEPAIDADNRNGAAIPACQNGFAQSDRSIRFEHERLFRAIVSSQQSRRVSLHANRIDTCVWSAPARHFLQSRQQIGFFVVDRFRSDFFTRHAKPLRKTVDPDHPLGAQ